MSGDLLRKWRYITIFQSSFQLDIAEKAISFPFDPKSFDNPSEAFV